MAKAKKAKIKKAKQSTQLSLNDRRWRPDAEIIERLFRQIGNKTLTAHDLTEKLASEKIRCICRSIGMGHVDVDKLCDIELERQILGETAAEHFSESLHRQLFEPFARVRASHGVVTPQRIIAAMGGDAGMILANGFTLGQYVARLAAEANLPRTPGHRELVSASFWAEHCFACSPNGDIRVGFRLPPNHHGPSEPSSILTANWAFYLWEPDCVKAWAALAPHVREADASERSPSGRLPDLTEDQVTGGTKIVLTELRRRRSVGESRLSDPKALSLLRERLSVTLDQATDRRLLDACIRPARRRHRKEISSRKK
jgi:hypothetical protein